MVEKPRETNGKTEKPIVPVDTDPKATDWSAATAAAKAIPIGRVSSMAERQRERDQAQPASSGASFNVSVESLVKLVGYVLMAAAMWWTLKSDLRDLRTATEYQTKIQEERWAAQLASNKTFSAKLELQQLDLNDIKLALARAGIYGSEVRIQNKGNGGGG